MILRSGRAPLIILKNVFPPHWGTAPAPLSGSHLKENDGGGLSAMYRHVIEDIEWLRDTSSKTYYGFEAASMPCNGHLSSCGLPPRARQANEIRLLFLGARNPRGAGAGSGRFGQVPWEPTRTCPGSGVPEPARTCPPQTPIPTLLYSGGNFWFKEFLDHRDLRAGSGRFRGVPCEPARTCPGSQVPEPARPRPNLPTRNPPR